MYPVRRTCAALVSIGAVLGVIAVQDTNGAARVGATEETNADPSQPPAVIVDADETTNRDEDERPGTLANLRKLGYPIDEKGENLLLRENKDSNKSPRRQRVADRYRVLLLTGDDFNDFANVRRAVSKARTRSTCGNPRPPAASAESIPRYSSVPS